MAKSCFNIDDIINGSSVNKVDKRWNDEKEITEDYTWNVLLTFDFAHKIEKLENGKK